LLSLACEQSDVKSWSIPGEGVSPHANSNLDARGYVWRFGWYIRLRSARLEAGESRTAANGTAEAGKPVLASQEVRTMQILREYRHEHSMALLGVVVRRDRMWS
jgi:hypothetical protein